MKSSFAAEKMTIVINSLFPVFGLLILGGLLKRWHLTNDSFLATSDKLIYYIFFPVLLFWKIGGTSTAIGFQNNLYLAAIGAVGTVFVLSTVSLKLFRITSFQAGSFSQSCYRFNLFYCSEFSNCKNTLLQSSQQKELYGTKRASRQK